MRYCTLNTNPQARANPAKGLSPLQEAAVGAVGALADEMLYRAVALTFLGGWLRCGGLSRSLCATAINLSAACARLPAPISWQSAEAAA